MKKFNSFVLTFMVLAFSTSICAQVVAPLADGDYIIQLKENDSFLDNSGYMPGRDNPNVGVFWPQGSMFQRFHIKQIADGYYRIYNVLSEESNFTVEGSSNNDMGNITQANWVDNDYQKWQIQQLSDGYCKVISKGSGKAWHGFQTGGEFGLRNLVQMAVNDGDIQKFQFRATADSVPSGPYVSGKTYAIASEMSALVFTEDPVGEGLGNVSQRHYMGTKSQQWRLDLVESGAIDYFTITNKESGLVITLEEGEHPGGNAITAPLASSGVQRDHQLWGVVPVIGEDSENHVNVIPKIDENRTLEITGGPMPHNGQNIGIWERFYNTPFWNRWQRVRFVMLPDDPVSVQSIEKNSSLLRVYPNPANDYIIVSVEANFGEGSVSLTDISGKVINHMPYSFTEGHNEVSYRLNGIASGIYFVKVKVPNGSILVKKVLIKE